MADGKQTTDPALLAWLRWHASRPMAVGETREQRISWIVGQTSFARELVEKVLENQDGR